MRKVLMVLTTLFATTAMSSDLNNKVRDADNGERLSQLFNNTISNGEESVHVYQYKNGDFEYFVRTGVASAQFFASKYEVQVITKLIAEGKLKKLKKTLELSQGGVAVGAIVGYKVDNSFKTVVQDKNKFIAYVNK